MDADRFLLDVAMVSLLVFTLLAATGPITGFLTFERTAHLSVESESGIAISRFGMDKNILIGNSTPISVEATNTGSEQLANVSFRVEVSSLNGSNTWEYFSRDTDLEPGEFLGDTFRHTPQETGTHSVNVIVDFQGQTLRTSDFLFVSERPEPVTRTVTIVRREIRFVDGPEVEEPAPPSRSWSIDAPQEVTLSQGETGTAAIAVENTGEGDIRNVRLVLEEPSNISTRYNPKILFDVRPGETKNFMLSMTPENSSRGRYDIDYRLISESFSRTGSMAVSVRPTTTIERLRQEITSMRLMVADATAQKNVAEDRGYSVEGVEDSLNRSRERIQEAEESLESGDIAAAQEALDAAREDVERSYQRLFTIRGDQVSVRAPLIQPVYVLLVASVLIGLIMVAAYYYMREMEDRRPALLQEE